MKKYTKIQIVDLLQWVLIIGLLMSCIYIGVKNRQISQILELKNDNTYVKIYDSQSIVSLKKENKELYDSIKNLKNIESVVQIEYVNHYISDTVFLDKKLPVPIDSVYHYENKTDSIEYKLDIKAQDLDWHKLDFKINDQLTLITKENNGKVETSIDTQTGSIENSTMWHRKNKTFKDRFTIGPTIGAGYGTMNKNFDVFVGVGITFDIW